MILSSLRPRRRRRDKQARCDETCGKSRVYGKSPAWLCIIFLRATERGYRSAAILAAKMRAGTPALPGKPHHPVQKFELLTWDENVGHVFNVMTYHLNNPGECRSEWYSDQPDYQSGLQMP